MPTYQTKRIQRIVHYYRLLMGYNIQISKTETSENLFLRLYNVIRGKILSNEKAHFTFLGKTYIIPEILLNEQTQLIQGKMYTVREEDFPMLYNKKTTVIRDVNAGANEGIVEVTHFVIDFKRINPSIGIEYNLYGAKINDFVRYLEYIGKLTGIVDGIGLQLIHRDNLKDFKKRIGKLSRIVVKVHNEEVQQIHDIDEGLASSLESVKNLFEGEYAVLEVKFDYSKKLSDIRKAEGKVDSIIDKLISNKNHALHFDRLQVFAQDSDRDNKLQLFDLLADKVKSVIEVEKIEPSRIVNSGDILQQMNSEMIKLRV